MQNDEKLLSELDRYYNVWMEFNYIYDEWAKAHRLSSNALFVLMELDGGKMCTQKMISEKWMIPKQTVNMILKDFEEKGLVVQTPSPEDRRSRLVSLTDEGKKYAAGIIPKLRDAELSALRGVGEERMRKLNYSLELFAKLLREAGEKDT